MIVAIKRDKHHVHTARTAILRLQYLILLVLGIVFPQVDVDAAATIGSSLIFSERQDRDGDGCFAGTLAEGRFILGWNVGNGGSSISGIYEKGFYRATGQTSWTPLFETAPYSLGVLANVRRSVEIQSTAGCTTWQYRVELWRNGSLYTVIRAEGQQREETPAQDGSTVVNPPPNDSFGAGTIINGNTGQVTGSNVAATKESGEPNHAGNSGGRSVWWRWTAPSNGFATFDTIGSTFNTVLAAYSGSALNSLTLIVANDDHGGVSTSRIQFNAVAGTTYRLVVDGFNGATGTISLNWSLAAPVPPTITGHPQNRVATVGTSTSFSVTASGTAPISYQWVRNGVDVPGATSSTLSFASVQLSDAGTYRVRVTNPGGSVISESASLTVNPAVIPLPTITGQPRSKEVAVGAATFFGVAATGAAPITYQWERNGVSIPGATDSTYNIASAQLSDAGTYRVNVTNPGGTVSSDSVVLTVVPGSSTPGVGFVSTVLEFGDRQDRDGDGCFAGSLPDGEFSMSWNLRNSGAPITVFEVLYGRIGSSSEWLYLGETDPFSIGTTNSLRRSLRIGMGRGCNAWQYRVEVWKDDAALIPVGAEGMQSEESLEEDAAPAGPPDNNNFADAINITGVRGQVSGTSVNATKEVGEPNHAEESGGRSVWWRWTAPGSGVTTVDTRGSTFDTLLAVYTGNAVGSLASIAFNDDHDGLSSSRVQFTAVAGTTYRIVVDGYLGSSGTIVLNWDQGGAGVAPPVITGQPRSKEATVGGFTSFGVAATGAAPITYQWQRNGVNIPGATDSTYNIGWVEMSDAGTYRVNVTNPGGTVTSDSVTLTVTPVVIPPPTITGQPRSKEATVGGFTSFGVAATGAGPITYQWQRNGVNIPGATDSTYNIGWVQLSDAGTYRVNVTNPGGTVTSDSVTLTVTPVVIPPPAITGQPRSKEVAVGAATFFGVAANGAAPITYQWQRNGVNIAGATNSNYNIASAQLSDAGTYRVNVTNPGGTVSSDSAVLTVTPVAVPPPTITGQPQNRVATVGTATSFSVVATGNTPITYQWVRNGSDLSGATGNTLNLNSVQLGDAGTYRVRVTNPGGSVLSDPATLTVNPIVVSPPTITGQPRSKEVAVGASTFFGVSVTGTAPITYQWQRNGVNIPGGTNSNFNIAQAQLSDAGTYRVSVSNPGGTVTSDSVVLTVIPASGGDPFVQRRLSGYVPGGSTLVTLIATPPSGTVVYGVEDTPPQGWVVGDVSDQGQFDAVNRKVKWTFIDGTARTLTYRLTAPANAQGTYLFTGIGNLDGVSERTIAGDTELVAAQHHPGDRNPADWRMDLGEALLYAAAYRRGDTWPVPPNPIDQGHAIRGLALYRSGEFYTRSLEVATPPGWWVNTGGPSGNGGRNAGLAQAGGTAVRILPGNYVVGGSFEVSIQVAPVAGTFAYGIEDAPPLGWEVSQISDGGNWDQVQGKVKWTFLDANPRTLRYQVRAPAGADGVVGFTGRANFDGLVDVAVDGDRSLPPAGVGGDGPRLSIGQFVGVEIRGIAGRSYVLESNTEPDAVAGWITVQSVTLESDVVTVFVPFEPGSTAVFYRAREQ